MPHKKLSKKFSLRCNANIQNKMPFKNEMQNDIKNARQNAV